MENDKLISRKEAKQAVHDEIASGSTVLRIWDILDKVPDINAVPLVHGQWKAILNPFWDAECSECGCGKRNGWKWGFCPNCGAKMDEGTTDKEA